MEPRVINVNPDIWAKAQLIGEQISKIRREARRMLDIPEDYEYDPATVTHLARETRRKAQANPQLLARVAESQAQLLALHYTFWAILSEDPVIDLDHFVYRFDAVEQKLYLQGLKDEDDDNVTLH